MIYIVLTETQLRAVLAFIGTRDDPDADTDLSRAEFALDLALMEAERA